MLGGDALAELSRTVAGLEQLERDKRALHAKTLSAVLDVHAAHCAADLALVTTAQLALSLDCSEHRAQLLLRQAQVLALLPDALDALASGLLGVEQSALFVRMTDPLEDGVRAGVWDRLLESLTCTGGPTRLAEALSRWIVTADPAGAEARRRTAERDHADVGSRRRDDGLTDLFACGLSPTNARACLDRISAASAPWGGHDDRPAGKRRVDALVDLLLGRQHLDPDEDDRDGAGRHCPPGCACSLQQPAPCGVNVHVHVPLGAALGTTDEVATLVDHGPLDPGQLRDVLMSSPLLRAVPVDSDGVPVSLGEGTLRPAPRDLTSVQRALLTLATRPPGPAVPRHPHDHSPPPGATRGGPPGPGPGSGGGGGAGGGSGGGGGSAGGHGPPSPAAWPHPRRTPGPYRIPAALRRLTRTRRPLCEWPGCGHRSTRCDLDHDLAWPNGSTCGCDLGPLCRRHHRIKQCGWTKARRADGVTWTSPTGRRYDGPTPFDPPAGLVRELPDSTEARWWASDEPDADTDTDTDTDTDVDTDADADADGQHLRISPHDTHCLARGAAPT